MKSIKDLIFVDMKYIARAGVIPNMVADHFPIYVIKKKTHNLKDHTITRSRSYRKYESDLFKAVVLDDSR